MYGNATFNMDRFHSFVLNIKKTGNESIFVTAYQQFQKALALKDTTVEAGYINLLYFKLSINAFKLKKYSFNDFIAIVKKEDINL